MHLMACLTVGDTNVTLNAVQSLDPADREDINRGITYTLSFHDLPSGVKEDVVYTNECDALYALAVWLVADETDLGALNPIFKDLQAKIKIPNKFLP